MNIIDTLIRLRDDLKEWVTNNILELKESIPSIEGLATEEYVNQEIDKIDKIDGTIQLTDYAKKSELPTKTSQLTNDSGFLNQIPAEYITETELNAKGYLTEHQDISNKVDKVSGKGLSTNDYTTSEKNKLAGIEAGANYVKVWKAKECTTFTSDAGTCTPLAVQKAVGMFPPKAHEHSQYLTEHQDLSDYATKSELHLHNNKTVLDSITSSKVAEWNNKSTFSGNYNDLTNKPTIPTKTSQLNNDSNYLTSIPSEYVTEGELIAKGYATQTELNDKLNKNFGSENAGKILVVDENGYLVLDDMSVGTSYPIVGVVDENNVITLSSDELVDGLYTLRYSDGAEYKLIGTVLVGERIATSITATKGKTTYEIGETLTTNDIVVTAHFNDLTSEVVTGYTIDSSSVKMNVEGNYTIIITYENCTTSIPIAVMDMNVTGNLFVASTCTIGKCVSSSGVIKDQTNTFVTDYIEIGNCMALGGENIIHWQGFHLYKRTSSDLANAGVDSEGSSYTGVAYYNASGVFLGQDSLYVTEKVYDSEGNFQLVLNSTYSTATKLRIFGMTLPFATSVNDLQNCKLTLNQLISEI